MLTNRENTIKTTLFDELKKAGEFGWPGGGLSYLEKHHVMKRMDGIIINEQLTRMNKQILHLRIILFVIVPCAIILPVIQYCLGLNNLNLLTMNLVAFSIGNMIVFNRIQKSILIYKVLKKISQT